MTVKELKEQLKSLGAKGFSKFKKAELEKLYQELTVPKLHDSEVLFTGECSGDGEWLQHRKIGATDTSILVVNNAYKNNLIDRPDKYNSPYLMYLERKGIYEKEISFSSQVAMDWGHYAEDFIIEHLPMLFEKEFKLTVEDVRKGNQVVYNPKFELWTCTPDSWVKINGEWYPVELKTGNSFQKYLWDRETVPDKYYAQVQQQLAVLGKEKGFLVGFIDNQFTHLYEIERDEKLINLAYNLTKEFQFMIDNNIAPELNGCEAECEYLNKEFKGFGNSYEKVPGISLNQKEITDYFSMQDTKKEIDKESKEIDKELEATKAKIKKEMLDLQTENLVVNGEYIATWKIDARGYKRFSFKELPENKKIREVA